MRWFTLTLNFDAGNLNNPGVYTASVPLTANTTAVPNLSISTYDAGFNEYLGAVSLNGAGGLSVTFALASGNAPPTVFSVSYAVQSLV